MGLLCLFISWSLSLLISYGNNEATISHQPFLFPSSPLSQPHFHSLESRFYPWNINSLSRLAYTVGLRFESQSKKKEKKKKMAEHTESSGAASESLMEKITGKLQGHGSS